VWDDDDDLSVIIDGVECRERERDLLPVTNEAFMNIIAIDDDDDDRTELMTEKNCSFNSLTSQSINESSGGGGLLLQNSTASSQRKENCHDGVNSTNSRAQKQNVCSQI
jgi:hypothetical protein